MLERHVAASLSRNVLLIASVAFGGHAVAQPAPPVPPAAAGAGIGAGAGVEPPKPPEEQDPFTFADFTWQSGSARTKDSLLGNQYFTGEFRLDDVFHYSFNR